MGTYHLAKVAQTCCGRKGRVHTDTYGAMGLVLVQFMFYPSNSQYRKKSLIMQIKYRNGPQSGPQNTPSGPEGHQCHRPQGHWAWGTLDQNSLTSASHTPQTGAGCPQQVQPPLSEVLLRTLGLHFSPRSPFGRPTWEAADSPNVSLHKKLLSPSAQVCQATNHGQPAALPEPMAASARPRQSRECGVGEPAPTGLNQLQPAPTSQGHDGPLRETCLAPAGDLLWQGGPEQSFISSQHGLWCWTSQLVLKQILEKLM